MDTELKTKWLEALRSGKYKQGKHLLRSVHDQFCCLGVLCDVIDPTLWTRDGERRYSYDGYAAVLPTSIERLAKIGRRTDTLIAMNDSGKPFTEIADYIEKEL